MRITSAGAALEVGDKGDLQAALRVLRDEGHGAARWAGRVAGLMADSKQEEEVRELAAEALAALGDAAYVPVLIHALREGKVDGDVVQQALETLLRTSGPSDAEAWEQLARKRRLDRELLLLKCSHTDARWVQRGLSPRRCPACGPSHPGCGEVEAELTERTVLTLTCACGAHTWTTQAAMLHELRCDQCFGAPLSARIVRHAEPELEEED